MGALSYDGFVNAPRLLSGTQHILLENCVSDYVFIIRCLDPRCTFKPVLKKRDSMGLADYGVTSSCLKIFIFLAQIHRWFQFFYNDGLYTLVTSLRHQSR